MPSAIKPSLGIINLDLPSFIGTFNSILLFGKLNSIGRDFGNLIFNNLDPVFIFSDAIIALILEFKVLPSIIICTGNSGLGRTLLTKGSDLDIYWGDGEVTTIKFLSRKNGPASKGDPVIINGKSKGWVMYNRDIRLGVFELGFKSSTGNTFSVQLGD